MDDIVERLRAVPGMTADWNSWLAQEVSNYAHEAAGEIERLRAALYWALGTTGDFPQVKVRGPYWWRGELAERAGIFWDGERWINRPNA